MTLDSMWWRQDGTSTIENNGIETPTRSDLLVIVLTYFDNSYYANHASWAPYRGLQLATSGSKNVSFVACHTLG